MELDTGRNEIAVSGGCVTESGEACRAGLLCEKLFKSISGYIMKGGLRRTYLRSVG